MSTATSIKHNDTITFLHERWLVRDWKLGSKLLNHIIE